MQEATSETEERDESYMLIVPADGNGVTLSANTTLGMFRGLTTFGQMWYDLDGTSYTLVSPIHIVNAPKFVRGSTHVRRASTD